MAAPTRLTAVPPTDNEGERLAAFLEDWASDGLRETGLVATLVVVDSVKIAWRLLALRRRRPRHIVRTQ
jgi:hypothetical protein